jgi:hypothetical protein
MARRRSCRASSSRRFPPPRTLLGPVTIWYLAKQRTRFLANANRHKIQVTIPALLSISRLVRGAAGGVRQGQAIQSPPSFLERSQVDHPAETPSKTAPEPLAFPAWFPETLRKTAHRLHEKAVRDGNVETIALLVRLVTDERMKIVWAELLKTRRNSQDPDSKYFHTSRRLVESDDAEGHQHFALRMIFGRLLYLVQAELPSALPLEKVEKRHYGNMARRIRMDAERLRDLGRPELSEQLLHAAAAYDDLRGIEVFGPRRDGDLRAKYVASRLAADMQALFGTTMYTIVAHMVSVALGREIKQTSVREWAIQKLPKPKAR